MRNWNSLLVRLLACGTFAVSSIAFVACGGDGGGSSDPEDAAAKAYEDLADGDWESVCSNSSEEAQQQYVLMAQATDQDCGQAAAQITPLTDAQSEMAETAEVGEVTQVDEERASVSIDFDSAPSGSVFLEKVDGRWLLSGVLTAPPDPQVDLGEDKSSLYLRANKPVVQTVEDFFAALADRDPARVCATVAFSDEAARTGTCEERYASLIKDMRKDRSLRDAAEAKVTDAGIDEDIASAAVTFGGTTVPVQLVRQDDEWKVTSFVRPEPVQTTTTQAPAP